MSTADSIVLRPWTRADIESLVRYANNRSVWINLRDIFPHPYTRAGAEKWIEHCESEASKPANFAIELSGEAIGGVGVRLLDDVHRLTAEIGYWIGEPFWGKGIATEALKRTTRYAFAEFGLERLQATVFEWNPASARVLEKAGYVLEGRMRRFIIKDGRIGDAFMYALLRS